MLIFSSKGWVDANKASQSTIEELQGRLNFFFKIILYLYVPYLDLSDDIS